MQFKSSCHLPLTAVSELLTLLQLLCPPESRLPKSVYKFRKFFEKFGAKKQIKQFCPHCHGEVINGICHETGCLFAELDCYVRNDIKKQLCTILSRKFIIFSRYLIYFPFQVIGLNYFQ